MTSWTDERSMPEELIELMKIPGIPEELRINLENAYKEVNEYAAVTYPTKSRIQFYLNKYSDEIATIIIEYEINQKKNTGIHEENKINNMTSSMSMKEIQYTLDKENSDLTDEQALKAFKSLIDVQNLGDKNTQTDRKICISKIKILLLDIFK